MEIIPSVLAKSPEELAEIKKKLEWYSGPLHIDVGDGQFVSTVTVGREEIEKSFPSQMLDVHLMVSNPADIIPLWLNMPNVRTIIFHPAPIRGGTGIKVSDIIDMVHKAGKKVGIAFNPETETEIMDLRGPYDYVHFMTVHPGNYGGEFQPSVVQKIADFHSQHPEVFISVDGGVNKDNVDLLAKAGVSACVVGSAILKNQDPKSAFEHLRLFRD